MMNLAEYRRTASRLADYLPWVALVGEGVVLNKDGSFQRTAKFRGPDLDSAVAAELVAVAGRLNNAFRRLGSGWAIFVEAQRSEAATYPADRFPDPASALVDAERKADFEGEADERSSQWDDRRPNGTYFVSGYFLTFLWLPPAALRTFQGRTFVVIEEANGQRRADVRLGIESDARVEILEGVEVRATRGPEGPRRRGGRSLGSEH